MKIPQRDFRNDINEYMLKSASTLGVDEMVTAREVAEAIGLPTDTEALTEVGRVISQTKPRWIKYRVNSIRGLIIGYRPLAQLLPEQPVLGQHVRFGNHFWVETIRGYLEKHVEISAITSADLVAAPEACPKGRSTHADAIIAGTVLRALGWQRVRHYQGRRGSTVYVRPTAAESVANEANEAHYRLRQQLADAGAVVEVCEGNPESSVGAFLYIS